MKVYLDDNNICHAEMRKGYTEAEHPFFDNVCTEAFECYKFIPQRDFIQCVDTRNANNYEKMQTKKDKALADVIDDAETMANELIGG